MGNTPQNITRGIQPFAELDIQLFGGFRATNDGKPIDALNQPRLQALMTYLLLHRSAPQLRHHLAFTFWPDVEEFQARNNLRQMLYQLRHTLPNSDNFLRIDTTTVQWSQDAAVRLDVAEFETAIANAAALSRSSDKRAVCQALEHAVSIYSGDLLPGCYDDWIEPERNHLRQQCLRALNQLMNLLEELRAYGTAISYAHRSLQLDSLNEETYLCLMRLHALNNDRASALRVYRDCVSVLRRELEVEPGAKIREAYERLLQLHPPEIEQTTASSPPADFIPLVGRQAEWEKLRAAWRRANGGSAMLVLITGEAGIGKTRLAEELSGWASQQGIRTARTRAYAAEGRLSYSAITEWLRSSAVSSALAQLDRAWLPELARLLPELLTANPELSDPGPLAEYWQRQRFFEALARGVLADDSPLLLQIDDLQWCDQETLEWLHFFLRYAARAKLLILGTARIEEMTANAALSVMLHSLHNGNQLVELSLSPLDAAETAKLATSILGHEPNISEAIRLFRETEGNPLFVVELMRVQLGRGSDNVEGNDLVVSATSEYIDSGQPLPPKVYSTIARRLMQLTPAARELAGIAATIGREFTLEVLTWASAKGEDELIKILDELWQRRIIREQAANTYDFSHDKLREVAYVELSPMQRRGFHRSVAQALERVYKSESEPVSGQLAAHYEQAGLLQQALPYYQKAAAVAQRVFAHDEAIMLLHKGLALLQTFPANLEHDQLELSLQIALSTSLVTMKGYGAPEVMDACSRAYTLCRQLRQPPSPPILRALVIAHIVYGAYQRANAVANQLLSLAEQAQDAVLLVEGHYAVGVASFWGGTFTHSRSHLERAIAHYNPQFAHVHIASFSQDPKVVCLIRLALDLWCLGYPDQAERRRQEALTLSRMLAHPFSNGYCAVFDCVLQGLKGNAGAVQEQAEAAIELGRQHGLEQWTPLGKTFLGWATADQAAIDTGIAQLQDGINTLEAMNNRNFRPYLLALLADLFAKAGNVAQSANILDEALDIADQNEERWYDAELHRRKAELMRPYKKEVETEGTLWRAIEVARLQEARSFELRAAISLARLWRREGKQAEARQLLWPIYNWFSEGFSTPDLKEASALLDSLEG